MEKSMTLTYQRHINSGIYDFKIFLLFPLMVDSHDGHGCGQIPHFNVKIYSLYLCLKRAFF